MRRVDQYSPKAAASIEPTACLAPPKVLFSTSVKLPAVKLPVKLPDVKASVVLDTDRYQIRSLLTLY
jgi:hypothetical protein